MRALGLARGRAAAPRTRHPGRRAATRSRRLRPRRSATGLVSPRIARSTASTAILPANAGACAFQRRDLALARLAGGGGGVQGLADRLVDRLDVAARAACRCRPRPTGRGGRRGRSCACAGRSPSRGRSGSRSRWRCRAPGRARRSRRAGRRRGSAGCCRRGASTRRRGTCRGSRVRARRRRWPRPPTPGSCAARARSRRPCAPLPLTETAWSSACCAGGADGRAGEGCRRHGGVVDDAVDDHVDHVGLDLDRVGGDLGDASRRAGPRAADPSEDGWTRIRVVPHLGLLLRRRFATCVRSQP